MSTILPSSGKMPVYRFYVTYNHTYDDWFLPSKGEWIEVYNEIYLYGLGSLVAGAYWSSSEIDDINAWEIVLNTGVTASQQKIKNLHVRACRSFTSTANYNLRDIGPAGGWIFWKSGNNYLELAPVDQSASQIWSNIDNIEIGATAQSVAIGGGQGNTTAIINQVGHTDSAAKLCDDYSVLFAAIEVFPLNFLETSLVDELESDQVFYRRKFNGSLLFGTNSVAIDISGVSHNRRDDWQLFCNIEGDNTCERIDLQITKIIEGVTTTYWQGYFATNEGKFDIDKCTFEVTPLLQDDYTDLLSEADNQYNFITEPTLSWVTTTAYIIGRIDIDYTRNKWLFDVIEWLADKVVPGVTVSSEFFTDATNPVTLDDNRLNYLTIAQKSDIKRPTASNGASVAMLSWNQLMEILWVMFQVRWNYDSVANTINVEHISWFTPGSGVDLRTQLSCVATNKYSYAKNQMPKYENFSFAEKENANFWGVAIWYDSACVNQDIESNSIDYSIPVTTDLEYIIANPDSISDDGFVILCNYADGIGNYYVRIDSGYLSGYTSAKLNMNLSWSNLHQCYFRHNRVLIEGYLNGILTTFWTARKTKIQSCSAILCDEFDPSEEITTELGETYFGGVKAIVRKAENSPMGLVKLDLLYGPQDNANTGVPNPFGVFGYLTITSAPGTYDGFDIDFYFSDPANAGISVDVRERVYDDTNTLVYEGGWNTVNFTMNTTYEHFHTALEGGNSLLPGWCIIIEFKYDDAEIDSMVGIADPVGWSCGNAFQYTVI